MCLRITYEVPASFRKFQASATERVAYEKHVQSKPAASAVGSNP